MNDILDQYITAKTYGGNEIVRYIQNEIITGRLKRGDKLPTERALSQQFGVSRTVVREGIHALTAMGVVITIQGSGNYVTSSPEQTVVAPIDTLFALNDGTLQNLILTRVMLELYACEDIIETATEEDIQRIFEVADYDYANDDIEYQCQHDRSFHCFIVSMSNNMLIKFVYSSLLNLMDYYRHLTFGATLRKEENYVTKREHLGIAAALKSRNMIEVRNAMETHMFMNKDYFSVLNEPYSKIFKDT